MAEKGLVKKFRFSMVGKVNVKKVSFSMAGIGCAQKSNLSIAGKGCGEKSMSASLKGGVVNKVSFSMAQKKRGKKS
jgi:hypothetical protein